MLSYPHSDIYTYSDGTRRITGIVTVSDSPSGRTPPFNFNTAAYCERGVARADPVSVTPSLLFLSVFFDLAESGIGV